MLSDWSGYPGNTYSDGYRVLIFINPYKEVSVVGGRPTADYYLKYSVSEFTSSNVWRDEGMKH